MMYTVATHLITQISGLPFSEFLQTNIFTPLKMSSTYLQPSAVHLAGQAHRIAKPYIHHPPSSTPTSYSPYTLLPQIDQPEAQGAALLKSTVVDFSKFLRALLTRKPDFLLPQTYTEQTKPRIICYTDELEDLEPFTSPSLYALGLEIEFYRGHRVVKHEGNDIGYGSLILYMPDIPCANEGEGKGFGMVIFGNASGAVNNVARILSMEIVDEVIGVPVDGRVDWVGRARRDAEKEDEEEGEGREEVLKSIFREEGLFSTFEDAEEISSGLSLDTRPTTRAMGLYTGSYENEGYHSITITINDTDTETGTEGLYIDATDRGMAFTMTLEHVWNDRKFLGCIIDGEGVKRYVKAEARFGEKDYGEGDGKATAVGIAFCEEMEGGLIWFGRV